MAIAVFIVTFLSVIISFSAGKYCAARQYQKRLENFYHLIQLKMEDREHAIKEWEKRIQNTE
jgi:hypothetical protein